MFSGLQIFFKTKNAVAVSLLGFLILFLVLCVLQNGAAALQVLSFSSLSFSSQINLFFTTLFDFKSAFTEGTLSVAFLSALLGGISVGISYAYFKRFKTTFKGAHVAGHGVLYTFVLLSIQCAACGGVLFTTLASVFGSTALLAALPLKGLEFGLGGVIIQGILLVVLLKKLSAPLVC